MSHGYRCNAGGDCFDCQLSKRAVCFCGSITDVKSSRNPMVSVNNRSGDALQCHSAARYSARPFLNPVKVRIRVRPRKNENNTELANKKRFPLLQPSSVAIEFVVVDVDAPPAAAAPTPVCLTPVCLAVVVGLQLQDIQLLLHCP